MGSTICHRQRGFRDARGGTDERGRITVSVSGFCLATCVVHNSLYVYTPLPSLVVGEVGLSVFLGPHLKVDAAKVAGQLVHLPRGETLMFLLKKTHRKGAINK